MYSLVTVSAGEFGVEGYEPLSQHGNAMEFSVYRFIWMLAIAWIIVACVSGFGGLPGKYVKMKF